MLRIKHHFPIFTHEPGLCYLDSAATSQKPLDVIETLTDFYSRRNANVRRGIYALAEEANSAYDERARQTVAEFIGAKPYEIVFTSGTTAGINIVARGFKTRLAEDQDVLTTLYEHNSNYLPWRDTGKVIFFDPFAEHYNNCQWLDTRMGKFFYKGGDVRLVAVTHLSNVTGVVTPVRKLANWAHSFGKPILVDAAQSIGHMRVNVEELGADFLVFSGHKMLGPTGIGVLYINEKWHDAMEPVFSGGGMVEFLTEDGYAYAKIPDRLEAGTPPIAEAIGLIAAIHFLQNHGIENVETHIKQLTDRCHYRLLEIGIEPLGNPLKHGLVSFNLPGIHPHDVAFELNKLGVAVRAGHHCAPLIHAHLGIKGSVRASFHVYNTFEDIDRLLDGLIHIRQTFGK
jgi:cysteine desulfurase/selenocysteine lyase